MVSGPLKVVQIRQYSRALRSEGMPVYLLFSFNCCLTHLNMILGYSKNKITLSLSSKITTDFWEQILPMFEKYHSCLKSLRLRFFFLMQCFSFIMLIFNKNRNWTQRESILTWLNHGKGKNIEDGRKTILQGRKNLPPNAHWIWSPSILYCMQTLLPTLHCLRNLF